MTVNLFGSLYGFLFLGGKLPVCTFSVCRTVARARLCWALTSDCECLILSLVFVVELLFGLCMFIFLGIYIYIYIYIYLTGVISAT